EYEERQLPLVRGDLFVFYTDGVSEALRGDEEYGVARLQRLVEAQAHDSATNLGERIMEDVERFTGGAAPADDLTMVVVKIL
ncbi:MAG TPA: SpoIIE family protein phosphatase, partial [Vicinamibacteria bacterium]|nr:SpoIIE family protein phosphatase [Vicinamibacteria bacterium]